MMKTTLTGIASFTVFKGQFTKARIIQDGRPVEIQLHGKEEYRQLLQQLNAGS